MRMFRKAYDRRLLLLGVLTLVNACGEDEGMTMDPTAPGSAGSTAGAMGRAGASGMVSPPAGGAGRAAGGTGAKPPTGGGGSGGAAGQSMSASGTGAAGMDMPMPMGGAGMPAAGTPSMAGTGAGGTAGMDMAAAGAGGSPMMGKGSCCMDGNCLCRGMMPTELTSAKGPYNTESYTISGAGCVFYPTDAEPPFAGVAVADGFGGAGGCGSFQTGAWGPLLASHGIVAMIVSTGSGDQPAQRGKALTEGIAAFKSENMKQGSPLFGKMADRYGTSGFSMGGGGTTYASQSDKSLKSSVAIMPWGPVRSGVMTPTMVICGASDGVASCGAHGIPAYEGIPESVPKIRVTVSGGHNGQPSAGGGNSGKYGLAFTKLFLEGDERWRPLLVGAKADASNVK